jgi:CheY-like chemotaxis protein
VAVALLGELGIEAVEADSGQSAIAQLGKGRVDLVLMDCSMPGMDGYETTRRIREGASGTRESRTPIVAMTARAQEVDRARAMAEGMDDYVAKPITLETLAAALDRPAIRSGKAAERSTAADAVFRTAVASPETAAAFDAAAYRSRYEDSPEVGREILELFLAQARPLFEEARAAAAAGDEETALARIHRLKGTTGVIGGMKASRAAGTVLASAKDIDGPIEAFGLELAALEEEVRRYLGTMVY